jgi:hypothetical protein
MRGESGEFRKGKRMDRRTLLSWIGVAVGTLALPGCAGARRHTVRFKMTVEVDTPQGLKTGLSVMEMSAATASPLMQPGTGKTVDIKFKGEAVAVDLPGEQTLFALVTDGYNGGIQDIRSVFIRNFDPTNPSSEKLVALFETLASPQSIGRTVDVVDRPYALRPPLVRFRDIRDPKTVELVDPNDLSKSFGPGVKLKRIFLTVVDEPVTVGIGKRLTWLGPYQEPFLGPAKTQTDQSLQVLLHHGDFRRGGYGDSLLLR